MGVGVVRLIAGGSAHSRQQVGDSLGPTRGGSLAVCSARIHVASVPRAVQGSAVLPRGGLLSLFQPDAPATADEYRGEHWRHGDSH